ncbi:hypothetical protein Z968_01770 [Clostridium novyi A str. 4552]|uniref:Uncharacterized protein n=1 Tax=Clostridium novyi A str. 4552 TaxID=1444289 RepID=A0A0A0I8W6_CLONO|nr:hypothetical protein [Clostridium novyi]KGM97919.1 hypothetical protein Z968_01770 [Clostridium novyi A str. 4552]
MKKYKISFILTFLIILIGLCKVNINLNRQIYKSIMKDMNNKKNITQRYENNNLDNMVDVLSYPEKYDIKSGISIPKIRVLFEKKPFDFRIDTNKYEFFINSNSVLNFKRKFSNEVRDIKKDIYEIGKKTKNIVP